MIRISKIHIKRFRSILDLKLDMNLERRTATICGANNTGKTNFLRAISLFFEPESYVAKNDTPYHKYEATRGGAVYPDIGITFIEDETAIYEIRKIFNTSEVKEIKGKKWDVGNPSQKIDLNEEEIALFLKNIIFFNIESINVSFPKIINNLVDNLYDIEFARTRFSGIKASLKKSFEQYTEGLLEVLGLLASEVNPLFSKYKEDWGIGFDLDLDVKRFRDLISSDISFYINDNSNKRIEGKGAGLQRLAYLLLHFRIIEKITNKSVVLLIDEPDVFLHQGLQKTLLEQVKTLPNRVQTFITTHSETFIDSFTLKNVFLFELQSTEREYRRRNKTFNVLDTRIVDLNEETGAKKIRKYLGIDQSDLEPLDPYNIMVEGGCDDKYLFQLMGYFETFTPNFIETSGVTNFEKYLGFYNSFYEGKQAKPKILVLFDNDLEGRNEFKRLKTKNYQHIEVKLLFTPNFLNETPDSENLNGVRTNHEIEDFIYPKIICTLANEILKSINLTPVNVSEVVDKISRAAHKENGILSLIENEKNNKNPDEGNRIKIDSIGFKKGLALRFTVNANRKLINLLATESTNNNKIKDFIMKIADPVSVGFS